MDAYRVGALTAEHPFPGLRPYSPADSKYFCGREAQVYALYRLLDVSRFVAVIGSSGSGKSSLVRAGLFPLLAEESEGAGGRDWVRAEMRPGASPIDRLAEALSDMAHQLSDQDDSAIAAIRAERIAFWLKESSQGIASALAEISGIASKSRSIVLVVDQFEELFRFSTGDTEANGEFTHTADESTHFVQLLLEAARTSAFDVRVLITMRSDFIGDCARFVGLPEAVSATQFLVPSLNRDQREEVIRKPIEIAGGSIKTELVERLLNDAPDTLDQLPVLQHCLLRLWERAGESHHLTLDHYREIGTMSGALSQHADSILADLAGSELAVEQVFRALAEVDREGRIIRRARLFRELVAETGVPAKELHKVLDRFRSDDCSFLTPSKSEVPDLEEGTRIDVGHEALLRRWDHVSAGLRDDSSRVGWLRAEEIDARNYRGLLAIADSKTGRIPADQVESRWRWWNERPRTEAWTKRYGGGIEQVLRLFKDSLAGLEIERAEELRRAEEAEAHKRMEYEAAAAHEREAAALRFARWARGGAVVIFVLLIIATVFGVIAERQRGAAEESLKASLSSLRTMISELQRVLDEGSASIGAVKHLAVTAATALNKLSTTTSTPAIEESRAEALLAFADVYMLTHDYVLANMRAEEARTIARQLVSRNPNNEAWQNLVYRSSFRVGDAVSYLGKFASALEDYKEALAVAQNLAAKDKTRDKWKQEIAFIENKIGDTFDARGDLEEASKHYQNALAINESLVKKDPKRYDFQRDLATAITRVGDLERSSGNLALALTQYERALPIREALVRDYPNNDSLASNLSVAYNRVGNILKQKGEAAEGVERQSNFDQARKYYELALKLRQEIATKDPANYSTQSALAFEYVYIGDLSMAERNYAGAAHNYQAALQIRQDLASRNRKEWTLQRNLANSYSNMAEVHAMDKKWPDALAQRGNALLIRQKLAADFPDSASRHGELITDLSGIGDVLVQQGDIDGAVAQFREASRVATEFLTKHPNNRKIGKKHETIAQKIAELTTGRDLRPEEAESLTRPAPLESQ